MLTPSPLPLKHFNYQNISFLPTGIGERCSQTISIIHLAAPLRRYELRYKRKAELSQWALHNNYYSEGFPSLSLTYLLCCGPFPGVSNQDLWNKVLKNRVCSISTMLSHLWIILCQWQFQSFLFTPYLGEIGYRWKFLIRKIVLHSKENDVFLKVVFVQEFFFKLWSSYLLMFE